MVGIVSNLVRIGAAALVVSSGLTSIGQVAAQGPEAAVGDVPAADPPPASDAAAVPAPDGATVPTTAAPADPPAAGASGSPSVDVPASQPTEPPHPSPSLPTDAISSLANPPDEAPSGDASSAPPPAPAPEAQARPPAPDIIVTDSRLLSLQINADGQQTITPATTMPYVVGRSCYSWELHYAPAEGELVLSEELVLPGPARNWTATPPERTTVNAQGTSAVTERHFDAATGSATAGWCVAANDPIGSYRYIIRQGDRELARFDFTVGDLL